MSAVLSVVFHLLGAMVIVVLVLGYFSFLAYIYFQQLKRRGHGGPWAGLAMAFTLFSALVAGFVALTHSSHDPDSGYAVPYLIGPVLLATIVIYAIARLLPLRPRNARTRNVHFPYAFFGRLLILFGLGQILLTGFSSGWTMSAMSRSFKLMNMALILGFLCLYGAKRAKARSANDILKDDPRPPVLYLRAFSMEEEFFVYLPNDEASKYSTYMGQKVGVTLEQYLAATLWQEIGPVVALGNPEDYVPPEGAARVYEGDENWKEEFLSLAHSAACIIIQAGASQNLQYELQALRREGLQEKAFILTPPKIKLHGWSCVSVPYGKIFAIWWQRVKGSKPTPWKRFAQGIRDAGYEIEAVNPAPGSILSFDRESKAILLATDAKEPVDFVAAIHSRTQGLCRAEKRAPRNKGTATAAVPTIRKPRRVRLPSSGRRT